MAEAFDYRRHNLPQKVLLLMVRSNKSFVIGATDRWQAEQGQPSSLQH
jgi:hypothetical protein